MPILVEIRPLPHKTWHGKKEEESFRRDKTVQVLINPATNRYATGLTPEESDHYGKLLGLDLSDTYTPDRPHPTWGSMVMSMKLKNSTVVLDIENPLNFVKVANLKACKFVAPSMKEYDLGNYPYATHVIHDERMESERLAAIINVKQEAQKMSFLMSPEVKCDIIQILTGKHARGKSQSFITVELDNCITENPEQFLRYAKMDKSAIFLHALILEAAYRNIVTKDGAAYYFMDGLIGTTIEDAIKFLQNPDQQSVKAMIIERMKSGRPAMSKVVEEVIRIDEVKTEA